MQTVLASLAAIAPFFIVRDLEESIDFYQKKLGFRVSHRSPDENPFFAIVERDGVMIFLKEIAPDVQPTPNRKRHEWARWDAYVYTPEPDALARELSATAEDTDDGLRGFEVTDPNGYTFFFGRPK